MRPMSLASIVSCAVMIVGSSARGDEIRFGVDNNAHAGNPNLTVYPTNSGAVIDYEIYVSIDDVEGDGADSQGLAAFNLDILTNTGISQPLLDQSPTSTGGAYAYTITDPLWVLPMNPQMSGGFGMGFGPAGGMPIGDDIREARTSLPIGSWDADITADGPPIHPPALAGVGIGSPATATDSGGNAFQPVYGAVRARWYLMRGQINVPSGPGVYTVRVSPHVAADGFVNTYVIRSDIDLTQDFNGSFVQPANDPPNVVVMESSFSFTVSDDVIACCLPDDSCTDLTPADCIAQGGTAVGPGTTCATATCPVAEACCLPDGTCTDLNPTACFTAGGSPLGQGTTCGTHSCAVVACCFGDGLCRDLRADVCAQSGGVPQVSGSACATTQCPTEACCFEDDGTCEDLSANACVSRGGTPQGAGTECATFSCPTQACCFVDGSCTDQFPDDCVAMQGAPQGQGTDCMGVVCPSEACCFIDGTCDDLTADECTARGGAPQGPGTDCATFLCPSGACCFADGTCLDFVADECILRGGTPQAAGTSCATSPCPETEACCLELDFCHDFVPAFCISVGGQPQGPGTTCPAPACLITLDDADFDFDGDVDLTDFAKFMLCYGGTNLPPSFTCPPGVDADLDNDGDVDLGDYSIFASAYTGSF